MTFPGTKIYGPLLWLTGCCLAQAVAAQDVPAAPEPVPRAQVDRIAAIVDDDVITGLELEGRLTEVKKQLRAQGVPLPAADTLMHQVLERMIQDMLQTQFARETGLRIDESLLDKTLSRIAQDNDFPSVTEFRTKLEQDGITFRKFREEIRSEMIFARLREREVDSKLVISDGEIENYLAAQARLPGKGAELQLAHILVVVPEQATADRILARQQRAEEALAQLKSGAEFAQVAAGYSDAQDAMQGGNMGWRPADRIPTIFSGALKTMGEGDISPILRSPNGFHIIKLLGRRSKDVPVIITQTHARHILIKTSEWLPESEARNRLAEIRQRLEKGADFAEQARLYSEDGSAAQGGELGWISPGDTVPEFEAAMNALKDGQLSTPVQTGFGWHLIQVLERRNADVSNEQQRQSAHMAIRSVKSDEAYQDWLRQLRDRAYVEYRLERAGQAQAH